MLPCHVPGIRSGPCTLLIRRLSCRTEISARRSLTICRISRKTDAGRRRADSSPNLPLKWLMGSKRRGSPFTEGIGSGLLILTLLWKRTGKKSSLNAMVTLDRRYPTRSSPGWSARQFWSAPGGSLSGSGEEPGAVILNRDSGG